MQHASSDQHLPHCPLCSGTTRPWLSIPCDWRRPTSGERYQLVWCDACEYGMVWPRPDEARIATFYDFADYYTHARQAGPSKHAPTIAERLRTKLAWTIDSGRMLYPDAPTMLRHTPAPSGRPVRVLDVGCGSGRALRLLRDVGCVCVGVEPDPKAAEQARESGLEVLVGTGESLPREVTSEPYDLVMMHHAMEHARDPLLAARSLAGVLRDGGVFLCEVPNNHALGLSLCGPAWHWLDVPRHLNFFTTQSMDALMRASGLAPIETNLYGFTRQVDPAWLSTERRITQTMTTANAGTNPRPDGRDSGSLHAWLLTFRGIASPPHRRFDSLRCWARKGA